MRRKSQTVYFSIESPFAIEMIKIEYNAIDRNLKVQIAKFFIRVCYKDLYFVVKDISFRNQAEQLNEFFY